MRRSIFILLLVSSAMSVASFAASWPQDWSVDTPESQGMTSAALETLWGDLKQRGTKTFLVVRNDHVVFERYAPGFSRTTKHYTASMAKALVGGVSLMLAMDDGRVKPDDLAGSF